MQYTQCEKINDTDAETFSATAQIETSDRFGQKFPQTHWLHKFEFIFDFFQICTAHQKNTFRFNMHTLKSFSKWHGQLFMVDHD